MGTRTAGDRRSGTAIPRSVWALGLVSLFMDVSSEMVHSLLPVFFISVLGMSYTSVGLIEGIAEAIALVTKVFSGTLSDKLQRRKTLALAGYGLSALTKPIFALAGSAGWVVTARFVDRIGKGIRGAPRDALIADVTAAENRGASYGLRQSLDSVGAFLGPLLAILLMMLLANDIRAVFWFALLPASLAVLTLLFGVREPATHFTKGRAGKVIQARDFRALKADYWATVALGTIVALAGFGEAFVVLRAQDTGLELALMPLALIAMNVVYAASSYPIGKLSDRLGRHRLLAAGLITIIAADLVLAGATGMAGALLGAALWGLYMGLTHGILAALVADTAPPQLRGTAFGVFNLIRGLALLLASLIAGLLWDRCGPAAPFVASAAFAAVALVGWLLHWYRQQRRGNAH